MGGFLRPGRRLVGALLLASLLAPVVPAAAQTTDRDWALCENRASAFSPAEVIASCTAIIQSATETEPDLSIAYTNRAHAYAAQANHSAALADLHEAVRLDPSSRSARYNRAVVELALQDYAGAQADLDELIRRDPGDWEAFHLRGQARLRQNDSEAARSDMSEAIRRSHIDSGPRAAELYSDRATAELQLRNYDAAISDFSVALQKNVFETRAYLGRATGHLAMKNWQFAFDDLTRFVEHYPSVQAAWTQRCLAGAMLGHPRAEVVADCERGRDLAPSEPGPLAARALVELKFKGWQHAFDLYDAGIAGFPDSAMFHYGRGIARIRLGQSDSGWDDILRATALDPGVPMDFGDFGIVP